MNENEVILVKLLSSAIRNREYIFKGNMGKIDWQEVYEEALAHQVHTLIYPVINKLDKYYQPEDALLSKWKKTSFFLGIELLRNYHRMGEVFNTLYTAGIPVIALKGLILNEFYPQPELRIMGDADILVSEENIERTTKILTELGYTSEKDKGTKHIKFFQPGFIGIELHRQLIEYEGIKNKENFDKIVWINPRQIEIYNGPVLAMQWELQVLHICLHMAFHIIYGGFGLRQLCDLVLIVESKGSDIDWKMVAEKSAEYGVAKFVYALFEVCNRLFEMEVPAELANKQELNNFYIEKLISDIFLGGNFGRKDEKRYAANILLKNSSNQDRLYKNKLIQTITLLFPSYNKLSIRFKYRYIKKFPILTPIAWCHRILHVVFRKDIDWESKISIFNNDELVNIAEERNELLHWFGLR